MNKLNDVLLYSSIISAATPDLHAHSNFAHEKYPSTISKQDRAKRTQKKKNAKKMRRKNRA